MMVRGDMVLRSCWYRGTKPALFHCWVAVSEIVAPSPMLGGHGGGVVSGVVALLELEDGSVVKAAPEEIAFADGGCFGDLHLIKKRIRRPAPQSGIGFDGECGEADDE